jgi:hypothetical protein
MSACWPQNTRCQATQEGVYEMLLEQFSFTEKTGWDHNPIVLFNSLIASGRYIQKRRPKVRWPWHSSSCCLWIGWFDHVWVFSSVRYPYIRRSQWKVGFYLHHNWRWDHLSTKPTALDGVRWVCSLCLLPQPACCMNTYLSSMHGHCHSPAIKGVLRSAASTGSLMASDILPPTASSRNTSPSITSPHNVGWDANPVAWTTTVIRDTTQRSREDATERLIYSTNL